MSERSLKLLISLLRTLHLGILTFVILGWLSNGPLLMLLLLLVPGLMLHWRFNQNRCWLSDLEARLRLRQGKDEAAAEGQFIKSLLKLCCRPLPPDWKIKLWFYIILWSAWLASLTRLLLHWKLWK